MKIRLIQILTFVILCIFLFGCSIRGIYYLRNFTTKPAKITLTLADSVTKILDEPNFIYSDELLKIRRNIYKKLKKSVNGKFIDERNLEFEIPAGTTLLFSIGSNMDLALIELIKIESMNSTELLNSKDFKQLNLKMRGIGQYTGHYDIK